MSNMARRIDLTGQRFGRLTVVGFERQGGRGHSYWRCKCDCGGYTIARGSHMKAGNVTSCGCVPAHKTHGESRTRLYVIWNNMKQRCGNPNSIEYHLYGGRGISVCDEWQSSYEAFRDWALANGYKSGLSIDRKENDGPYCPDNCRWATAREQANNTRRNRLLTYDGETRSIAEWARVIGVKPVTLRSRIDKYHWSVEDALKKGGKNYVS